MKEKKGGKGKGKSAPKRWVCKQCNYIYSEQLGEPHNGIKPGTAFEDLPDTYVCPVCGYSAKGKVGKWGFEEWVPTRFVCKACGYIYDKARGEPHHGIKPGTAFEDLPDDYVCPVCAIDPGITRDLGKVGKEGFEPILL
jgi:rubredoxin